jgi:hypothetical protein
METNISITFRNLTYPSFEQNNIKLELEYENRYVEFSYPLTEPLKLILSKKLILDKVNMVLSIIELTKKMKVLYKGTLVLNKNIFIDSNSTYEKLITLIPTETFTRDIKKEGKVVAEVQILDNFEEWKKSVKLMSKKKTNQKFDKHIMNNNNLNNNKVNEENNKVEFDDNISLINLSKIDDDIINKQGNENIDELINIDYITQLKNILEKDYQQILPTDIDTLKNLNKNLYEKYTQLGNTYNEILTNINSENESLRQKAIEYFNKYKEQKKKLYQLRVELKEKKSKLDSDINIVNKENTDTQSLIEKYKSDKESFLSQLPKGETSANNLAVISSGTNNTEIKMLSEAIKKISSLGYDVIDGAKISDEERKLLSVILGTNLCDNLMGSNSEEKIEDMGNIKDDFDFGNKIVALIERDVNELYSRKVINQVKIDQIDAITYSFADSNVEKEVAFKIENNNLFCIDSGDSFTVWLLKYFKA